MYNDFIPQRIKPAGSDPGGNIVVHALMSVVGRSFLLIDIEKGQSIFSDALVGRVLIFAVYC
jgi:hypothetical protein